jgi:hypothetical protein
MYAETKKADAPHIDNTFPKQHTFAVTLILATQFTWYIQNFQVIGKTIELYLTVITSFYIDAHQESYCAETLYMRERAIHPELFLSGSNLSSALF